MSNYTYDIADRLIRAKEGPEAVRYSYNAAGDRISENINRSSIIYFLWD